MSEARRWTPEEVAAAWERGEIRPWQDGAVLATPRGARNAQHGERTGGFVDFSLQGRNERLREQRRQRAALEALERGS